MFFQFAFLLPDGEAGAATSESFIFPTTTITIDFFIYTPIL